MQSDLIQIKCIDPNFFGSSWPSLALRIFHWDEDPGVNPSNDYRDAVRKLKAQAADKARFDKIAKRWEQATLNMSSPNQARAHPLFEQLVEFGDAAIPWAKDRLDGDGDWDLVLHEIVGSHPPVTRDGDTDAIRTAWLNWDQHEAVAS